jgi:alpha-tubulin suppressor-like RCC1 family protein/serine/threonine protein kinase
MLGDPEAQVAATDLESEYEILGELGRGATAVVYRARDRELGREVAIKVIRPKFVDDDETVARLAREARTVAQLQHPNIVTLYAVRRVRDGSLALVMQLVPGRTLREILNDAGAWTFSSADRVLRDVASALSHAHERGIVHRDVKPENIFIDETTGRALLSDFGVARSLEADSQLTATGTAIGTPAYMSPEQIDGTELDGRSDVYSLGLVGWEMLTGRRPWEGEGLYSVIFKQKREELQPIDELRPDTPNRLIYLVEGAIGKRPEDRWSSAAEFVERASTIAPEEGWSRWNAERKKRRRTMVYSAARERGDSILSAAIATVRFQRDLAGRVDEPAPLIAHDPSDDSDAVIARRTPPVANRPKRSIASALVVTAVVLAAVAASARIIRGRAEPAPEAAAPTTFADNGGVEVPVTVSPPNAPRAPERDTMTASTAVATRDTVASGSKSPVDTRARSTPDSAAITPRGASASPPTAARSNNTVTVPQVTTPASPPPRVAVNPGTPTAPADSARTPLAPVAPPAPAAASVSFPADRAIVAAGGRHSCSLDEGGRAVCWGANDQGQLGDGTHADNAGPATVAGDLSFAQLSAGASHTCGVTRDGDVYCWGDNERGQLGDATSLQRDTPVRAGTNGPFKAVRSGYEHSCGLSRGGEIACWGSNSYGQLGSNGGLTSTRPVNVTGSLRFGAMAVGWNHTCGITMAGDLYCWGSNNVGQLGDGTRDDRRVPTRVASSLRFVAVAAGTKHTCAVAAGGELYCWGRNDYGQLATGPGDRSQPTRVEADLQFATIAAGAVHTCARTTAGQLYCWGRNTFGQVGDGTTTDRPAPVRVASISNVVTVQATGAHTCAATTGGETYCWGYNVEGQLGDGTRNHRSRPVRVSPTR